VSVMGLEDDGMTTVTPVGEVAVTVYLVMA
jgi:hypothetical protein